MNRRQLLIAAPAATLMAPSINASSFDTPVMKMFRHWEVEHAAAIKECEYDESCSRLKALIDLEYAMIDTPSIGPLDLVAKISAYNSFGASDAELPDQIWREAAGLVRWKYASKLVNA